MPRDTSTDSMHAATEDCEECRNTRRIVVLTSHVFLPGFRKASVHFVAENWAAMGHEVSFITVGHSGLTFFKQRTRFEALRAQQANRLVTVAPRLQAGAYLPPLHAFSARNALANRLLKPFFRLYGSHLPDFAREAVEKADLVVLESGTALVFFDLVRRLNPTAKTLYFCRDLLHSIGTAPLLQETERARIGAFDAVCVPSRRLGEMLPPGGRVTMVPQGVNTALFDAAAQSPYPPGTHNAVAVGDMLFDRPAVTAMAEAAPHVTFHLFGISWPGEPPANVKLHGEQAFETIVAYIRHADMGLAPYRMTEREVYLAESSLKLLQYAYCRLPVLLPDTIPAARGNEITYTPGQPTDWAAKIAEALAMPHDARFAEGILTWRGIAADTLKTVYP